VLDFSTAFPELSTGPPDWRYSRDTDYEKEGSHF
jgi:hypothetical protein